MAGWRVVDLVDGWADCKALAMVDLKESRWVGTLAMMLDLWKGSQRVDWKDMTRAAKLARPTVVDLAVSMDDEKARSGAAEKAALWDNPRVLRRAERLAVKMVVRKVCEGVAKWVVMSDGEMAAAMAAVTAAEMVERLGDSMAASMAEM